MRLIYTYFCYFFVTLFFVKPGIGQIVKLPSPEKAALPSIINIEQKAGRYSYSFSNQSNAFQNYEQDFTQLVDVIIEFKEAPLFVQRMKKPRVAHKLTFFQSRFTQFSNDLSKLETRLAARASSTLPSIKMKREYHKAFFGASLSVPRGMLPAIGKIDYVKKIHFDKKVKAYLNVSVPLIRADEVHNKFGTKGQGIVIGIIDSGIDYMHPALGGGFGPGFKVIGGYDFVNDDADPIDDNNHGTHVAGIVAANGDSISGVAPEANLVAFKVLNSKGQGDESNIIAAIERVVDPNNDGDFSDKLDVVNISLGFDEQGSPDDAMSTAVDNAVKLGVTFCIAAGNGGDFHTIGTPGMARLAITVGASDKNDNLASFSSKGPNRKIFSIKPEVVAPGVQILSTLPGAKYAAFRGTSMAAPHVAGVCALLKSIHPDWTPAQIKSALMTTAVDLGEGTMVQGSGRIDALNAASVTAFANPAHLSFGLADPSRANWVVKDTLQITNHAAISQTFMPTFTGIEPGISLSMQPSSFTLLPGETQEVITTLNALMDQLPNRPRGTSLSYDGTVLLSGTKDTLRLPWAFSKTITVTLVFDEPEPFFLFTSSRSFEFLSSAVQVDPYTYVIIAPVPGTYNIYAILAGTGFGPPKVVIKERLPIQASQTIEVLTTDAVNLIDLNGIDEQGKTLASLDGATQKYKSRYAFLNPTILFFKSTVTTASIESDSLYISNVSELYTIFASETRYDLESGDVYLVQHEPLSGVNSHHSLQNESSDFSTQNIQVNFPPNAEDPHISLWISWSRRFREPGKDNAGWHGVFFDWDRISESPWNGKLFFTPNFYESYGFSATFTALLEPILGRSHTRWITTNPFTKVGDKVGSFKWFAPRPDTYLSENGGTMLFGDAPIYPVFEYDDMSRREITAFPEFRGSWHEIRSADLRYTTYTLYDDENNEIRTGRFFDETRNAVRSELVVPVDESDAGPFRFEFVNTAYFVGDIPGRGQLINEFDTRRSDPTPPTFTSLKLLNSEGIPVSRLQINESATLEFSAADFLSDRRYQPIIPDSTRVFTKTHGTDEWQEVGTKVLQHDTTGENGHRQIGYLFSSDFSHLSQLNDSTVIDLKIGIGDLSGNTSEWIQEPAFTIGDVIRGEDVTETTEDLPKQFALYANYPNPFNPSTTIRYDLPENTRVVLRIYNVLGQVVRTLVNENQTAGVKSQVWDGRDDLDNPVSSGVYLYGIEASAFKQAKKLLLLK